MWIKIFRIMYLSWETESLPAKVSKYVPLLCLFFVRLSYVLKMKLFINFYDFLWTDTLLIVETVAQVEF